ncbi:hypothetical protein [Nonomuraea zeae]|uniref:Secreted protein n=1 Tax=Nonomuraea zeae TaxID=1642303 RepID=A0A5S4GPX6_9ACTN|nr:hypothetical protein [Nonomuraea zeae]TMR34822.1 hypothetical protein ETD85_15555 [Nonomuraea zeae]
MLLKWLRNGLLATLVLVGLTGIPSTATASTTAARSCSHRIEWYKNQYEVDATEVITCNPGGAGLFFDLIVSRVKFTSPRNVGNRVDCAYTNRCSATIYLPNTSAQTTYCATAFGGYIFDERRDLLTWLPQISSCTTA